MPGRDIEIASPWNLPQQRQFVSGARSESGPAPHQFLMPEFGNNSTGKFDQPRDPFYGIAFVKSRVFFGGASKDQPICTRDKIATARFNETTEQGK
jgi:hypothetical protein